MTVKTTNRSHRITYLVIVLAFAVALSTALVLAGERNPDSHKKNVLRQDSGRGQSARMITRSSGCAKA